jgi:hypothetical protein
LGNSCRARIWINQCSEGQYLSKKEVWSKLERLLATRNQKKGETGIRNSGAHNHGVLRVLCATRPGSLRLSAHLRGFGVYRGLMEASGLGPERKRLAPHCRRGWVPDGGQKSLQRMRQLHILDQLRL